MRYVGIDIGSTATKVAVMAHADEADKAAASGRLEAMPGSESSAESTPPPGGLILERTFLIPTGYSSVDAADRALELLKDQAGLARADFACVATGYGRISVPYADRAVTEITCHGRGAAHLFGPAGVVIDVGGQDTKVMQVEGGTVKRFVMNDKCSAGTGRFLEVMADRLGLSQAQLADLAARGRPTAISNMCTVFAESEVISLVGKGEPRENIAHGVVDSVVRRVASLAAQIAVSPGTPRYLTGGLCDNAYFARCLGEALTCEVATCPQARFAGAIGAAVTASML